MFLTGCSVIHLDRESSSVRALPLYAFGKCSSCKGRAQGTPTARHPQTPSMLEQKAQCVVDQPHTAGARLTSGCGMTPPSSPAGPIRSVQGTQLSRNSPRTLKPPLALRWGRWAVLQGWGRGATVPGWSRGTGVQGWSRKGRGGRRTLRFPSSARESVYESERGFSSSCCNRNVHRDGRAARRHSSAAFLVMQDLPVPCHV